MGTNDFIVFGQYVFTGIKKKNKIEITSVSVNPQTVYGARVDGQPDMTIQGNKINISWNVVNLKNG